jgi:hypothetical protein
VQDPALRSLLDEHWRWARERWPDLALRLGDASARDRFTDRSPEALKAEAERAAALLLRARAINASVLDAADRETLAMFVDVLENLAAEEACRFDQWRVSSKHNALANADRFAGAGSHLSLAGAGRLVAWAGGNSDYEAVSTDAVEKFDVLYRMAPYTLAQSSTLPSGTDPMPAFAGLIANHALLPGWIPGYSPASAVSYAFDWAEYCASEPTDTANTASATATCGVDADGDGVGSLTDCDDVDPSVYPGAPETWPASGSDVNCDGWWP